MAAMKVSDIESVGDLLEHPDCVKRVATALLSAKLPESAEEFLSRAPLTARLGAAVGQQLYKEMGIQSRTEDAATLSGRYGHVLLALLCGLAEQGIALAGVEEGAAAADCLLVATVPSSALSVEGELSAHMKGSQGEYRVESSVTFKGQKFAWGRGKRILKKLFEEAERLVEEYEREGL